MYSGAFSDVLGRFEYRQRRRIIYLPNFYIGTVTLGPCAAVQTRNGVLFSVFKVPINYYRTSGCVFAVYV